MTLLSTLFPTVTGNLPGSISFAHVVMRIFARCKEVEKIIVTIPGSDAVIESESISATTARLQLGARYGILVAVLEMLKAAIHALCFRICQPESTAYMVAAGMATVGHIWPVFYRFKGGRG